MAITLGPIGSAGVDDAAGVLARAFRDNPGTLALLAGDGPDARERLLGGTMRGAVEATRRWGTAECLREGGRVVAVSLSFVPGAFPMPAVRSLALLAPGVLRGGLRRAARVARLDAYMRGRHPHYRHHYLWFLGVEPERQGRGLGSELLRALSSRADATAAAAYLETDKPTSVKLYEGHGYRVTDEEDVPGIGFHMWFMKRPEVSA